MDDYVFRFSYTTKPDALICSSSSDNQTANKSELQSKPDKSNHILPTQKDTVLI